MKCADLPDEAVIAAILQAQIQRQATDVLYDSSQAIGQVPARYIDLVPAFPDVPDKVLRAKLGKLIRRKLITGCICGCRGDFTVVLADRLTR